MEYDKNAFTAGIAVGRQLKGWAAGGQGGAPTPSSKLWFGTFDEYQAIVDAGEIDEDTAYFIYQG